MHNHLGLQIYHVFSWLLSLFIILKYTIMYNIEQRTVYTAHQIQYFRKFCIFEPKLGPTSQDHLDSLKQSSEDGEEEDRRK